MVHGEDTIRKTNLCTGAKKLSWSPVHHNHDRLVKSGPLALDPWRRFSETTLLRLHPRRGTRAGLRIRTLGQGVPAPWVLLLSVEVDAGVGRVQVVPPTCGRGRDQTGVTSRDTVWARTE